MTPEQIIAAVCASYDITIEELRSPQRARHLVEARRDCIASLRMNGLTTVQIGGLLNRDHSAVLHHLKSLVEPLV